MDLQQTLWWDSIGAECAAFVSLLRRQLASRYRCFSAYLLLAVARGVTLHFMGNPRGSRAYAFTWMLSEPLLLLLLVLTTIEIVGKVPEHYRGFGVFGRNKLRRLLDIAIVVALISSMAEATGPQWSWSIPSFLRFTVGLHRVTTSILAVYLLLVALFVSRVRVPFRRNLLLHS